MADAKSRRSTRLELTLGLRVLHADHCPSSWRDLTSCQISLPPHSDLTIRMYGGSDTAQVLFQSIVDLPTNTVGRIGRIPWNASTQLPTVVSTVIAVGQTEYILDERLVHKDYVLGWYVFLRPTRSRGLLPRSRVQISGVSRISGTTFATGRRSHGLTALFASAIKALTKTYALWGPGLARLLPLIYQRLATVSPATLLGRCFGQIRNY